MLIAQVHRAADNRCDWDPNYDLWMINKNMTVDYLLLYATSANTSKRNK